MLSGQVTPAQVAVGPVPGRLIRVVKVPVAPPAGAVPNVPLNIGAASPAGVARKNKTRKNAPQPRRVRMLVIVRLFIMMVVDGSATLASGSAAVSALIKALERGDAVIFLEIRRFGRNLRRVERNLFRIFLRLDFDETVNWLFHRFRQIV